MGSEMCIRDRRKTILTETLKKTYPAYVIDISHNIATLETKYAQLFHQGDILGVKVPRKGARYLGVVIDSESNVLTVLTRDLREDNIVAVDKYIEILDYEPLINYDLQLDMLNYVTGNCNAEEINVKIFHNEALDIIFKEKTFPPLRHVKLSDIRDVREGFRLDKSQINAIEAALGLEDYELLLIVGPPGTGKTRVIAKIAYELAKRNEKVLITSHTNRAVDNAIELLPLDIALRVGRPEKILKHVKPYLLSYRARELLGKELREIEEKLEKYLRSLRGIREELKRTTDKYTKTKLKEIMASLKSEIYELIIRRNNMIREEAERLVHEIPIVGSTLIKSQLYPLQDVDFDTVIIDEASQASITLALLAMVKGKKWIIVGDHKQLLPIFKTVEEYEKRVKFSAFASLLEKYRHRHLWLTVHYRSHPDIIGFSAKYIYENRIKPDSSCYRKILVLKNKPKLELLDHNKPVVFVHVLSKSSKANGSKVNEEEVKVTCNIVKELIRCGVDPTSIGIITPYRAQRELVIEELGNILKNKTVEVGTVDAFQGREKDVIIFSITDTSTFKFSIDSHRLNVAFTRAKLKLIVLGNVSAIAKKARGTLLWKFVEYCDEKEAVFDWQLKTWRSVENIIT